MGLSPENVSIVFACREPASIDRAVAAAEALTVAQVADVPACRVAG